MLETAYSPSKPSEIKKIKSSLISSEKLAFWEKQNEIDKNFILPVSNVTTFDF